MAKGVHNSRESECISWILKTGCQKKGGVTEPTLTEILYGPIGKPEFRTDPMWRNTWR